MTPWFILWAAYRWTGDKKYLVPFDDDPAASLRQSTADALDILQRSRHLGQEGARNRRSPIAGTMPAMPAKPTSILRGSSAATRTISTSSIASQIETAATGSLSIARAACGSIASTSTTVSCSARGSAVSR